MGGKPRATQSSNRLKLWFKCLSIRLISNQNNLYFDKFLSPILPKHKNETKTKNIQTNTKARTLSGDATNRSNCIIPGNFPSLRMFSETLVKPWILPYPSLSFSPNRISCQKSQQNQHFSLSIKKKPVSHSRPVCTKYVLATNGIIPSQRTKSTFEIKQEYQQESVSQVCISLHLWP